MTRLLAGEAQRTDGRLTVSNLATEAGLTRQQAYRSPVINAWRDATSDPPPSDHPDKTQARIERLTRDLAAANNAHSATDRSETKPAPKPRRSRTPAVPSTRKTRHYEPRSPTHTSSCRSVIALPRVAEEPAARSDAGR